MSSSSSQKSPEPDGLLRILASVFSGVLFGLFLSKLRAPIQESVNSISPKTQTDSTNRSSETNSPLTTNVPPTPSGSDNSCKCCHHKTPRWKILLDVGMLLATAGAFGAASYYAHISRKMWGEMQQQTKTARQQLESSERPWIKVDFAIGPQGFTFQEGGAQLPLQARFQNIGHSTATSVFINVKMFLAEDANGIFKEPLKRQHELCDPITQKPTNDPKIGDMMLTIFPGDTDESMGYGVGVGRDELESVRNAAPKAPGGKRILPIIFGCVDYQYGTSERHHQTRFIYDVNRIERNGPGPPNPFYSIEVPKPVAPKDVALVKYGFGGFVAD